MSRISYIGLVFIVGCVTNNNPPPGGPDGGGGGNLVAPKIGTWHYAQVTLVTNSCNSNVQTGESGDFLIDASQLTSFHVMPNDGTESFTCSLSTGAFNCPNRTAGTMDYRPSIDAVATYHVDVDGTFSDPTHGSGTQKATVDCAGTQCSLGGAFPCTFSQRFAIVAL
jgi:hypothetical protein